MNDKLIIAAAGSGKTTHIIEEALKIKEKVLITTFTDANETEIKKKFYELVGYIPQNITIQTWFSFLIQHGVKPYQSVLYDGDINGLKLVSSKSGFRYYGKNNQPVYFGEDDTENYYLNKAHLIYSDKLSKFVFAANAISKGLVIKRIEKIFSYIFIDEVQDMAGYDLEIIKLLFYTSVKTLLVGDPRQITYHTHEETKNKQYSKGNLVEFIKKECKHCSVKIDDTTLNTTHRNNKAICDFANSIFDDMKPCNSDNHYITGHDGVFFVSNNDVDLYLSTFNPVQLRDSRKTNVNSDYIVYNFGESKGMTFERVLIYPTQKMLDWIFNHSRKMPPISKSKFYVGVTRAKYSVAIVFDGKKRISVPGISYFSL